MLVIATVFLMGMHSTFFVPAKLGAMPEILHPSILSRGNGVLEGTSFTAQILGTSAGGILYSLLKGDVSDGQIVDPGREWMIGVLLLGWPCWGRSTAFLMHRIPAAAPDRKTLVELVEAAAGKSRHPVALEAADAVGDGHCLLRLHDAVSAADAALSGRD